MNIENITKKLSESHGWQAKYREIMLFGKQLPELPEALKVGSALVSGCDSKVWLYVDLDESAQQLVLIADSDTRIVKGLLAIIIAAYAGKTPEQASQFSAYTLFESLGLISHLSPSRGNGIRAIVDQIQMQANRLA
ncbi:SufE family protein [Pseudoalteromonas sp. McH1-7]|uniref:Cysteine desulfuration protein SufE n=1 Tax=Pseudoalteromonas peptidolytica F12-50-A1 TaxID=1315280 RepID=A0A8I0T4J8_9GAMM|nr:MULTISPECIES: SufE family protein [Pseudoalteromonas]MBE0346278.1 cysteine desulfuration protein SufE [Pseudoalteromonas peptidolytica F12-50-A1]MDW7548357.1 SufE family protein [Pseudoalteromonas peptidolytica]NLR14195.1 SufE family protein [Pseudoalteromonas peptidolytica]NUZ09368.1 SufE family protein [Pseudoalteromonas sp. McH1-7]RRS08318.1 SufE family protein [Pseudoalteromonas sp. J010]